MLAISIASLSGCTTIDSVTDPTTKSITYDIPPIDLLELDNGELTFDYDGQGYMITDEIVPVENIIEPVAHVETIYLVDDNNDNEHLYPKIKYLDIYNQLFQLNTNAFIARNSSSIAFSISDEIHNQLSDPSYDQLTALNITGDVNIIGFNAITRLIGDDTNLAINVGWTYYKCVPVSEQQTDEANMFNLQNYIDMIDATTKKGSIMWHE